MIEFSSQQQAQLLRDLEQLQSETAGVLLNGDKFNYTAAPYKKMKIAFDKLLYVVSIIPQHQDPNVQKIGQNATAGFCLNLENAFKYVAVNAPQPFFQRSSTTKANQLDAINAFARSLRETVQRYVEQNTAILKTISNNSLTSDPLKKKLADGAKVLKVETSQELLQKMAQAIESSYGKVRGMISAIAIFAIAGGLAYKMLGSIGADKTEA